MSLGSFYVSRFDDGSVNISYEDYGTYGGSDYEVIYKLDAENADKLTSLLLSGANRELDDLLTEKFGKKLDKESFGSFCEENDIKYRLFTWID